MVKNTQREVYINYIIIFDVFLFAYKNLYNTSSYLLHNIRVNMILKSKYFKKLYYYSLTIHCVHLSAYSEIDLSQLLYSFWRVGIIMSKLKNKLMH